MIGLIVLVIVIALVITYIVMYNGLQRAKVNTDEAWSQIDVQLQRRNDLIPNLVETTKGYAKHERETSMKLLVCGIRSCNFRLTLIKKNGDFKSINGCIKVNFCIVRKLS